MSVQAFPSLYGAANVDELVEGANQVRLLVAGEPSISSSVSTDPLKFGIQVRQAVQRAAVR